MRDRLTKLRERFSQHQIDGLLLTAPRSLRYITGFSGSNGCALVGEDEAVFITDFRYKLQAQDQVKGFQRRMAKDELFKDLAELDWFGKKRRLGLESTHVSLQQMQQLRELLPPTELVPVKELVEEIGLVKEKGEIEYIRQAVGISDGVFGEIVDFLRPGLSEVEVCAEIEYRMRKEGSERLPFDAIVVSGARSALPHGQPAQKRLQRGDLVTMDYGARVGGYCSDFTRTVVLGQASEQQREIYQVCLRAQEGAEAAAKAGMTAVELDGVARQIIADAGYGDNFGHGLGHGLGLEVHEGPRLSPKGQGRLESGMVVTIEPGIYLPQVGGVRIEDVVVIREEGCEVLTQAPKDFLQLGT
jgi:Xaa-Pro aminopeptidase